VLDHDWATARGPRAENQDRAATAPGWLVVSDGIGGHAGGARAAATTVDAVADLLGTADQLPHVRAEVRVADAVELANTAVRAGRDADPEVADMGATVVVALLDHLEAEGSTWRVASAGDSPAWLVTSAGTQQITHDDNVAGELARRGAITAADAESHPGRHLLVRAVGLEPELPVHTVEVRLQPGDALVLATDGLSGVVDRAGIHRVVTGSGSMAEATAALVDLALRDGTTDNVTVAAVRHRVG
jgi:protein phosphatase